MIVVVAAALCDELEMPTRILAARRRTPADLAGRWELPGGKVEKGESPTDALRRELLEELHVSVTLGAELRNPAGGCWPISADLEMRVWFAVIGAGKAMLSSAHDGLAWRGRSDLAALDWLDADRPVVAELTRRLGQ